MEVKTHCNGTYGSEAGVTFCHDSQFGKCCSISTLPAQDNCTSNTYPTNELEDCAEFDFVSEKMKGILTFKNTVTAVDNGGYWIRLTLKDNSVLSCDIFENGTVGSLSRNFECLPSTTDDQ